MPWFSAPGQQNGGMWGGGFTGNNAGFMQPPQPFSNKAPMMGGGGLMGGGTLGQIGSGLMGAGAGLLGGMWRQSQQTPQQSWAPGIIGSGQQLAERLGAIPAGATTGQGLQLYNQQRASQGLPPMSEYDYTHQTVPFGQGMGGGQSQMGTLGNLGQFVGQREGYGMGGSGMGSMQRGVPFQGGGFQPPGLAQAQPMPQGGPQEAPEAHPGVADQQAGQWAGAGGLTPTATVPPGFNWADFQQRMNDRNAHTASMKPTAPGYTLSAMSPSLRETAQPYNTPQKLRGY